MTRSSLARAAQGIGAGVTVLAFVVVFLSFRIGGVSLPVLAVLIAVGVGTLAVVAGPSAIREVFGRDRTPADGEGERADWWLANLEPVLEDVWNRWSDLVLVVGLAGLAIGSFVLLVVSPEPPLGLLVTGFIGMIGAIVVSAVAVHDE